MVFHKVGDSLEVAAVFCSCGQELQKTDVKCPKCGKELLPVQIAEESSKEVEKQ